VPHTATVRTLDEFRGAFESALAARDLSTIVAKVEATGPSGYVTDLALLENRFEFQRWLRTHGADAATAAGAAPSAPAPTPSRP
jgi:sulfopyruvate decarboxylase subunit beta